MRIRLFFFLCLGFGSLVLAQNQPQKKQDDSLSTWSIVKYDALNTWKSVKYSVTRPAHWKGRDYRTLGLLVAGTMALSSIDEPANRFFVKQDAKAPQLLKDFGWYFGSPQNYFMANAGLYGVGLLTKNESIRKTSILIISSSVTTGFIQTLTKNAIGRADPVQIMAPLPSNLFRLKALSTRFLQDTPFYQLPCRTP